MKEIVAYQCDYCDKISRNKELMKRHEKKCYYNPMTKSCATCKYLIFGSNENPENPSHYYDDFQSCIMGLEVTFRHLKTNCDSHEVRPESEDEIEHIRTLQGPFFIKAGQSCNIPE